MFKYWSWLVSLGKHFLTYLVWIERKIWSYDGARFPCLTHLCKISDMRIFKPSSTSINMPSAENKLADIINILTSNVVKTLQRFPRFWMVFSYSRFILDGKGKKKESNMDRDGRMSDPCASRRVGTVTALGILLPPAGLPVGQTILPPPPM